MTCSKFPLRGKHILIADDDEFAAEILARTLVALGATAVMATTTEDALRQTQQTKPVLSVLELQLRGRETESLRQALYERRIPFVAYTALHHRAHIGRWAAMPLVYKPDECGEVGRTVVRLSENPPSWPCTVS